jgi:hypothetical protein
MSHQLHPLLLQPQILIQTRQHRRPEVSIWVTILFLRLCFMICTAGWMLLPRIQLIHGTPYKYPLPPLPQIQGRIFPLMSTFKGHSPPVLLDKTEQIVDIPLQYPNSHQLLFGHLHQFGNGGP